MGTNKPSRWRGMLAPIGKPTGDGRMFAPESLSSRDLPLPLRFQRQDGGGHGGAVVVGRILKIDFRDDQAYAEGDWLDEKITPEVAEAKEWTRQRIIGPSVDLDDAVMEMVPAEHATDAPPDCSCELAAKDAEAAPPPMMKLVTKGRISGATLVQIPAFAECAALELSDDSDWDDDETLLASGFAPGDPVSIAGEDDDPDDIGYFVTFSDDGEWLTVVRDTGDVERIHASRVDVATGAAAQAWADALTAAAAPVAPPAAWFDNPKLAEPTALTITEDGRVFGHLAKWGTCHVGMPGCTTAPRSKTNYAFFHTGELITDDGQSLEVGKITLGTGHAHPDAGFRAAADHYDNSGSCVAVVRAGEDSYGIWVAGALTDGCDDRRVAELRRSPLSGDWRRVGNNLELVAALAVNVGGFPVPRSRVASGHPMSLVAAGTVEEFHGSHNQADHAGKFTPRGKLLSSEGIGVPKPLKARKPPASSEGHGAFWKKDRNSMAIEENPEDVFRRMMKRKKKFEDMIYVLDDAADEAQEIRQEQLAADLLLLDPEFDEYHGSHNQADHAGGRTKIVRTTLKVGFPKGRVHVKFKPPEGRRRSSGPDRPNRSADTGPRGPISNAERDRMMEEDPDDGSAARAQREEVQRRAMVPGVDDARRELLDEIAREERTSPLSDAALDGLEQQAEGLSVVKRIRAKRGLDQVRKLADAGQRVDAIRKLVDVKNLIEGG